MQTNKNLTKTLFLSYVQFKDIPKLGEVDSPFFRRNLNIGNYSSFNAGLLHPGMGPPSTFVSPSHLASFAPKVIKITLNKLIINIKIKKKTLMKISFTLSNY